MPGGLWPEIRASLNGEFWQPVGTLLTVNGTAVPDPYGPGFPADLGRAMDWEADGMFVWEPVGYPAAIFPMRGSVEIGKSNLRAKLHAVPSNHKIVLAGFSQGSIAVNQVWRDDILNPAGELHHRLGDVIAIFNWGDPLRCPGIARGNELAGIPVPGKAYGQITGGVAGPDCLTPEQTPPFMFSRANPGDLYASAPVGANPWSSETEVGHNHTLIYEAVMDFNGGDLLAFAKEIFEIVSMPWSQVLPLVQAIYNGMRFLVQGAGPHNAYEINWAVRHLIDLGNRIRAES